MEEAVSSAVSGGAASQSAAGTAPPEVMLIIADYLRKDLIGSSDVAGSELPEIRRAGLTCALVAKSWLVTGYSLLYDSVEVLFEAHVDAGQLEQPWRRQLQIADAVAHGQTGQAAHVSSVAINSTYAWKEAGYNFGLRSVTQDSGASTKLAAMLKSSERGTCLLRSVAPSLQTLRVHSSASGALGALKTALPQVSLSLLTAIDLHLELNHAQDLAVCCDLASLFRPLLLQCTSLSLSCPPMTGGHRVMESFCYDGGALWAPHLTSLTLIEPTLDMVGFLATLGDSAPSLASLKVGLASDTVALSRGSGLGDTVGALVASLRRSRLVYLGIDAVASHPFMPAKERRASHEGALDLIRASSSLETVALSLYDHDMAAVFATLPPSLHSLELAWKGTGNYADDEYLVRMWQALLGWLETGASHSLRRLSVAQSPSYDGALIRKQLNVHRLCVRRGIVLRSDECIGAVIA